MIMENNVMWPIRPIDRANALKTGIVAIIDGNYYDSEDIEYMTSDVRDNLTYIIRNQLGTSLEDELARLPVTTQITVLLSLSAKLASPDELELPTLNTDMLVYNLVRKELN